MVLAGIAGLWLAISLLTGTACFVQSIVGLPCPGCGSIRSVQALWHGAWAAAFYWHPLVPITALLLPVAAPCFYVWRRKGRQRAVNIVLWCVLLAYLGVYVVRLAMFFPHTEPMSPHPDALWRLAIRYIGALAQGPGIYQ